jgi:hypothetical protein
MLLRTATQHLVDCANPAPHVIVDLDAPPSCKGLMIWHRSVSAWQVPVAFDLFFVFPGHTFLLLVLLGARFGGYPDLFTPCLRGFGCLPFWRYL